MKKIAAAPMKVLKKADKVNSRAISQSSLSRIKSEIEINPGLNNGELFRYPRETMVSRTTQCHLLKKVEISEKPLTMPPLTKVDVKKHL